MDYNTGHVSSASPIRCDWLDVTFSADSTLPDSVADFLLGLGSPARRINDQRVEYRIPGAEWGNVLIEHSNRGWARLSASGGSCDALRSISAFGEYLGLISEHPHTLTRLDACLDLQVPAAPIIQHLVELYPPDSSIYLTRKGVSPGYNLQPLAGGGITGTFYAGDLRGKARVLGRVYDKQAERAKRGIVTLPWVRYELVIRKGVGATIRDAENPGPLFWHFAAPSLLNAPPGISPWVPFEGDTWAPGTTPVDPYQKLRRAVDSSVDLERLALMADSLDGDGRRDLLRLIRTRLGLRDVAIA